MEKKKGKKKVIAIISIIAVVALLGVGVTSCVSNVITYVNDTDAVGNYTDVATIERQDLSNSISVSGTVEGGDVVKVSSTLTTKVKTLNVKVGDYVKTGDILCVFDSSEIQTEYDNLKESIDKSDEMNQTTHEINQRNLENAKIEKDATLSQAQRNIDDAVSARDKAYEKYNSLVGKYNDYAVKKDNLYNSMNSAEDELEYESLYQEYQETLQLFNATETELDALGEQLSTYDSAVQSAQDAYDSAERSADISIQSLQDTINAEKFSTDTSSQAQLDKLQEKLDQCTVTAPRDGIITSLNIAEGSIATTDDIMTIEDNNSLKITVQIKEADILNVKEGMQVIVKTTATDTEEINGTVSRVVNILSGKNDLTQSDGGYTAEITIDDKNTNLLIGMNAKAKIILEEKKNVLAVPYDAITQDDDGNDIIYIAEKSTDGTYTAKSVKVEKGLETDYYTEINSSEINEGDLVILSTTRMKDGKTINIDSDYLELENDGE